MTEPYEVAGAIRRALAQIADHYDVALIPPRRGTTSGTTSKEPPPPVNIDVLDARNAAHKDLAYYAMVVLLEVRSIDNGAIQGHISATSVPRLAKFLDTWALHLAEGNPTEAEACARDLTEHGAKLRALALPDRRDWMPLGTCPLALEDDVCGGQVRAYPGKQPACMQCGTEGAAEWWERVMFPDVETSELVTADELVLVLHRAFGGTPTSPTTIRTWISRGVLVSCGKDDKGRSLFDRASAIYAIARRQGA